MVGMDSRHPYVYPRTSPRWFLSRRSVLFRGPPCEHAPDKSQRPTEAPPAAAGSTRPWSPRVPRRRRVSSPTGASTGVTFQSYLDGLAPRGIQSTYFFDHFVELGKSFGTAPDSGQRYEPPE